MSLYCGFRNTLFLGAWQDELQWRIQDFPEEERILRTPPRFANVKNDQILSNLNKKDRFILETRSAPNG